jgi:hypothetical protein
MGELGCMDREQVKCQLHQTEKELTLSAERIRRQDLMIRRLELDGHLAIAATAKRLRKAFLKSHASYVARRYKLMIDLVRSYIHHDGSDVTPQQR